MSRNDILLAELNDLIDRALHGEDVESMPQEILDGLRNHPSFPQLLGETILEFESSPDTGQQVIVCSGIINLWTGIGFRLGQMSNLGMESK